MAIGMSIDERRYGYFLSYKIHHVRQQLELMNVEQICNDGSTEKTSDIPYLRETGDFLCEVAGFLLTHDIEMNPKNSDSAVRTLMLDLFNRFEDLLDIYNDAYYYEFNVDWRNNEGFKRMISNLRIANGLDEE